MVTLFKLNIALLIDLSVMLLFFPVIISGFLIENSIFFVVSPRACNKSVIGTFFILSIFAKIEPSLYELKFFLLLKA
jgi:capsule polysaccharide export protein KpsE/RkpR